ncbi:MAG: ABC transporter permease [Lachnospiraceae bacterium]
MKESTKRYIRRKIIELLFTLFFVTLLSFLLMRVSSVDPATAYAKRNIGNPTAEQIEAINIKLGFDRPLAVQYANWVIDLFKGDLGTSLANGRSVWSEIMKAFPKTISIVLLSSVMQVIGIIGLSCTFFLMPWRVPKKLLRSLCVIGISIPSFYIATIYLDYFAVKKNLISVTGNVSFIGYLSPAICLAVFCIAFYVPMLTDALQRESEEEYAFYGRSRGFTETWMLVKHFLPKALIGLLPSFLQNVGLCLAGATIIEQIFSIPGFGYLIVNSVLSRDTPMIHAEVFFLAFALSVCNILADVIQWGILKGKGEVQ